MHALSPCNTLAGTEKSKILSFFQIRIRLILSTAFVCISSLSLHVPPGVRVPQFGQHCFRWTLLRTGMVYAKLRGIKNKWKAFFWGKRRPSSWGFIHFYFAIWPISYHIQVCMKKVKSLIYFFEKAKYNKHWIKAHTRLAKGHSMHFGLQL